MQALRFISIALVVAGFGFIAADETGAGFTFAVVGSAGIAASYHYDVPDTMYTKSQSWLRTYDELVPDYSYELAFKMPDLWALDWCPRHEDYHPRAPNR